MTTLYTNNNEPFEVDDYIAEELKGIKFYKNNFGYIRFRDVEIYRKEKKCRYIMLHSHITKCPKGLEVDHIDGNKLNNKTSNLRTCTKSQNMANIHRVRGKSGYLGVYFSKEKNRFRGEVMKQGKKHRTKYYRTVEEAAKERDKLAVQFHGEFATLNFPSMLLSN
jgi:hypothetical protein